ncbi:hypothetical protein ABZ949_33510 [Micromonospora tulbaghiae]|uniref:hypothetical protein n=1 Tax=Micromonospora tulbaghiae TaxID=479978 RepID=UPI0034032774
MRARGRYSDSLRIVSPGMDPEDALIVAAGDRLVMIATEIIFGVMTGQRRNMWSMLYGNFHATEFQHTTHASESIGERDICQKVSALMEHHNTLALGATTLVMALAQLYAGSASITEVEALQRAQELMHAGFEV